MINSEIFPFIAIFSTTISISFIHIKRKYENIPLLVSVSILALVVAYRGPLMGTDTDQYRYIYSRLLEKDFYLLILINDPFYYMLMRELRALINDGGLLFQVLNSLISFTCIYIAWIIQPIKNIPKSYHLLIFLGLSIYINYFNGMRQTSGMSLGLLAYILFIKRKYIFAIILFILGCLIHKSIFILILVPTLFSFKTSKKNYFYIWITSLFVSFSGITTKYFLSILSERLVILSDFFLRIPVEPDFSNIMIFRFIGLNILYYLIITRKCLDLNNKDPLVYNSFLLGLPFINTFLGTAIESRISLPIELLYTISIPMLLISITYKNQTKILSQSLVLVSLVAITRSVISDSNGILPFSLQFQ